MADKNNEKYLDTFKKNLFFLYDISDGKVEFKPFVKEREVGIFFKRKKKQIEGNYILRKGKYISFIGFCTYIQKYIAVLNEANSQFYKTLIEIMDDELICNFEVYCETNVLNIKYQDFYDKHLLLSIDICELPKVLKDEKEIYTKIKDKVYKYLRFINSYKNFSNLIQNDIAISEKLTLKIEGGLISSEYINVKISFDKFSLFEVKISKNDFKISTFSKDLETDMYLENNKAFLFTNICIEESKVKKIIEICDLISGIVD